MKVNYQERIEDTVTVLKIIMSQQRTVTLQTKSSGTLFVKIWFEPEHYRCSWGASHFCKSLKKG
jgi:alanine-alpha-ketoisovalerate/valine-pyruvate aminotransferase